MLDTELGQHISKAFDIHQIFSTSELAAPIFARSIMDHSTLAQFSLDNQSYFISDGATENNITNANHIKTTFPENLSVIAEENPTEKINIFSIFIQKFNYIRSPAFSHLRQLLLILFGFIVSASLFLKWAMPLSYTNALYFVMTTVTTVGYGDINFFNSPTELKVFGCFLMLSGAAAIAMLFSSITEIILAKRLPSILGGLPVPNKNHVIIAGSGHIGHRIVKTLLKAKTPIVIMEDDIKNCYSADINRQVALVEGYLHSHNTLIRARIQSAKAIIVITDDDIQNLSISLAAKKINPNLINIIQVFNSRLGQQLQSALSVNRVLSTASIAAPYFAAAVFGEEILMALEYKNSLIFLSRGACANKNVAQIAFTLNQKTYPDIRLYSIPLRASN